MAAGRDMKVSVLVQLVDRLTSPLRGMMRGISSIGGGIANIGRQIGVVGGALAGLSFMAPIQQAAAWDASLRDIAITAGKTGGEVEKMIGDISGQYQKLALETGQRSAELAKGAQLLVASGMDASLIDKLMPTIGRVATAANATIEDTAKTAFALSDTLKVAPDQMEAALGKLVVAGKLGRFEFKNMAAEFPALTNQMAKFGITGMEAVSSLGASLQIAMLGTANPSEAATNLKNFLTKINAPEAIKKFEKELKVDVTGVMTDAAAKGINPVEAVIQKMSEKLKVPQAEIDNIMKKANAGPGTDKDKAEAARKQISQLLSGTKVGRLYADMQVLDFLIPTLLNLDKLKDFKNQVAEAGADVINQDFESRMRGLSQQLVQFGEIGTQALRRIGLAFASNLPMANRAIAELLRWVAQVDAVWPGLIDGVLSWTGMLLALGAGVAVLTPVFAGLAAVLGVVKAALLGLLSPIGLVAAILASAATLIISRWETFAPFFARLGDSIAALAGPLRTLFQGLLNLDFGSVVATLTRLGPLLAEAFRRGWDILKITARMALVELDKILGTNLAGSDTLRTLVAGIIGVSAAFVAALPVMAAVGAAVAVVGAVIAAVTSPISLAIAGITALAAAGIYLYNNWEAVKGQLAGVWTSLGQAAGSAWEGAKAAGDEFAGWCGELPGRILAGLGNLAGQLLQMAQAAGQSLLDGIRTRGDELTAWAATLPGRIVAGLGDLAGQLMQAGQSGLQGLLDGSRTKGDELTAWAATLPGSIVTGLGDLAGQLMQAGQSGLQGLLDGARTKGNELVAWAGQLPGLIVAGLGDLAGQLMQAGQNAIQGLWDGMAQKFDALIGYIKGKIAEITGALKLPSFFGGGSDAPGATNGVKNAPAPATDPMGNPLGGGFNPTSSPAPAGGSIGGSNGFAKTAAANSNVQVGGKITVEATEGARVVNVQSTNPAVPVTPNRGAMLGRA
jgi:TP901 family phage tail tape measure protein